MSIPSCSYLYFSFLNYLYFCVSSKYNKNNKEEKKVFCDNLAAINDTKTKRSLSGSLSTDFHSFNVCLMLFLNSCL